MKFRLWFRDGAVSVSLLVLAFFTSLAIDRLLGAKPLIPLFFVLAVFLVALLTSGYFWGISASLLSVLAVNYAFTYPFFAFNFEIAENAVSALIILVVGVSTCTLTRRIRTHEKLQAELEKEKMRSNLLRAVSHDLRTPLTSIYGASSTILENEALLTEEDRQQMLCGIQEDARWLIRMVENLLSITKIDNQNIRLSKTPVVVEELVDAALAKFRKHCPSRKVEVELPEAFCTISADPILLQQVLVNFLENAAEHALGMTRLQLLVRLRNEKIVFEVLDNGCGIPEEKIPGLFSGTLLPDTVSADSRKHSMGIGLSVCATIVKAHGGEIYARNRRSGGMCFGFSLDPEEVIHEQQSV